MWIQINMSVHKSAENASVDSRFLRHITFFCSLCFFASQISKFWLCQLITFFLVVVIYRCFCYKKIFSANIQSGVVEPPLMTGWPNCIVEMQLGFLLIVLNIKLLCVISGVWHTNTAEVLRLSAARKEVNFRLKPL